MLTPKFGGNDEMGEPAAEDPLSTPVLEVELDLQTADTDPPLEGWLPDRLRQLAQLADAGPGHITVAVVDDAVMADLHERYTGVTGTTDVLTFDLRDELTTGGDDADGFAASAQPLEADLVVCLDEAQRQASQRGHEVRLELLLYALHGLLHLLGYDDHDSEQSRIMHLKEDELLTKAGLGEVYGRGRHDEHVD